MLICESSFRADLLFTSSQLSWPSLWLCSRLAWFPTFCKDEVIYHLPTLDAGHLYCFLVPESLRYTNGYLTSRLWKPYAWFVCTPVRRFYVTWCQRGLSDVSGWHMTLLPEGLQQNKQRVRIGIYDWHTPPYTSTYFPFMLPGGTLKVLVRYNIMHQYSWHTCHEFWWSPLLHRFGMIRSSLFIKTSSLVRALGFSVPPWLPSVNSFWPFMEWLVWMRESLRTCKGEKLFLVR